MAGGTLRGCAEQVQYRSRWSHSLPAVEGQEVRGHMLEFGISVMFRVSGKVHGGVMQERWFPGQEAAHGGTPGDEGGRVGGEVEGCKRKTAPCHGGLR